MKRKIIMTVISVLCIAALLMTGASAATLGVSGQTPSSADGGDQASDEMLGDIINSILAESLLNQHSDTIISLTPGDALLSRLYDLTGVDFSWIETVELELDGNLRGLSSSVTAYLYLNGDHLLTLDLIVDMSTGRMYMRIPELSDVFIEYETEESAMVNSDLESLQLDGILEELTPLILMASNSLSQNTETKQQQPKSYAALERILTYFIDNPIVVTWNDVAEFSEITEMVGTIAGSMEPMITEGDQPDYSEETVSDGFLDRLNKSATEEISGLVSPDDELISFRVLSLDAGESYLTGELLLQVGEYLTAQLFAESGLPTLAESIDVTAEFYLQSDSTKELKCDFYDGDDMLLRISVYSRSGGNGTVPAVTSFCDPEEWTNIVMENGGYYTLIENLYMSDIPDELLNAVLFGASGDMYGVTSGEASSEMY